LERELKLQIEDLDNEMLDMLIKHIYFNCEYIIKGELDKLIDKEKEEGKMDEDLENIDLENIDWRRLRSGIGGMGGECRVKKFDHKMGGL